MMGPLVLFASVKRLAIFYKMIGTKAIHAWIVRFQGGYHRIVRHASKLWTAVQWMLVRLTHYVGLTCRYRGLGVGGKGSNSSRLGWYPLTAEVDPWFLLIGI